MLNLVPFVSVDRMMKLVHRIGVERMLTDLAAAIEVKLAKNAAKYPVEKARGNAKKYTEL